MMTAEPSAVAYQGISTLNWSAENATACIASGGWSGSKSISGSEPVGPLTEDAGYGLTCTGDGGEVFVSTTITVNQLVIDTATLSWVPPTSNEDGSPLNDLAGYKVYYGTSPGSYPNVIDVANPGIASYVVENLSPNTYYFVITAYNSSGDESVPSNGVSKVMQ
ncbi:MAG: fibronectin type III domain-containing protein [Gammaproteobacteria bacterium]|nr:fibronectin type III domain-containing protein [Gammaproteobacteria bacterium]